MPLLEDFLGDDGPWADQAHVSAQHVPKLRQLIQASLPEGASHPGHAGIFLQLVAEQPLDGALRMLLQIPLQSLVAIRHHRPEFPQPKLTAPFPDPGVRIEYRPPGFHENSGGDQHGQR
jgi:hypothetical protein